MNRERAIDILGLVGQCNPLTEETIGKMYHKLALIYHPDKGGNPEMFRVLQLARDHMLERVKTQDQEEAQGGSRVPNQSHFKWSAAAQTEADAVRAACAARLDEVFSRVCNYPGCTSKNMLAESYCTVHKRVRKTGDAKCRYRDTEGTACKRNAILESRYCSYHRRDPRPRPPPPVSKTGEDPCQHMIRSKTKGVAPRQCKRYALLDNVFCAMHVAVIAEDDPDQ